MTMSVFVYDAVDLCKYSTRKIYVMFSLKCMSSGQKNTTGIIVPYNFVVAVSFAEGDVCANGACDRVILVVRWRGNSVAGAA